jgi:hypothetical protein
MASHKKPEYSKLYSIAERQAGYFTSSQAAGAGFSSKLLWHFGSPSFLPLHTKTYSLRG